MQNRYSIVCTYIILFITNRKIGPGEEVLETEKLMDLRLIDEDPPDTEEGTDQGQGRDLQEVLHIED